MAPIDPTALLKAFEPWLTADGGIRQPEDVVRLSLLMKRFSKKLVSRCIYLNVLMKTSEPVLEKFLEQEGWLTLNQWLNAARAADNTPFTLELLRLLERCPVSVERLKQTNTAKLVKNLSKEGEGEIAAEAKKIVEKWKGAIRNNSAENDAAADNKKSKDKKSKDSSKRKESSSVDKRRNSESDGDDVVDKKRRKLSDASSVQNSCAVDANNKVNGGVELVAAQMDADMFEARPSTVKVKHNTTRSIGITPVNKVAPLKLKLLTNSNNSDKPPAVKLIEPLPINSPTVTQKPTTPTTTLTESAGFMDALVSRDMPSKVKKVKKSHSKSTTSATSPPSAKKDAVSPATAKESPKDSKGETNDEDDVQTSDQSDETVTEESSSPPPKDTSDSQTPGSCKSYPRGCLRSGSSSVKKSIRWVADDSLTDVRYFEVDETERTNVFKEAMESKRAEGQAFRQRDYVLEKPVVEFMPWRVHMIDFPPGHVPFEFGKNSKEREVQAKREALTMRDLNLHVADFPAEPDTFEALVTGIEQTVVIPLEDVNNPNNVADFSNAPHAPTAIAYDQQQPQYDMNYEPTPFQNSGLMVQSSYTDPSAITSYTSQQGNYTVQSTFVSTPGPAAHQPDPWMRDDRGRDRDRGRGFNRRDKKDQPCRFWMQTGRCKFNQSCNYSHTRDAGPHLNNRQTY